MEQTYAKSLKPDIACSGQVVEMNVLRRADSQAESEFETAAAATPWNTGYDIGRIGRPLSLRSRSLGGYVGIADRRG